MKLLRAFCLITSGALGACTSDLTLRVPIDGRAESVILGVEQRGSLRAYAFPAKVPEGASHIPLQIVLGDGEDLAITALVYAVELAALSLSEGEIPPAAAGEETRGLPPQFIGAYRAELAGGDAGEWAEIQTLGAALAAFELAKPPAPPTICDRVRVTTVPIENEEGLFSVALAGDSRALALRNSRSIIRVGRSGAPEEIDIPGTSGAMIQVESDHQGTTYGTTFGGTIFQLDDDAVEQLRSQVPLAAPQISIARDGRVFAYDGGASIELSQGSTVTRAGPALPPATLSALIVSDDRIAAITGGVVEVFDGASWTAELRDSRLDSSASLFGDEGVLGVVQEDFGIAIRDDARRQWTKLEYPVTAFLPYSGQVLGGGRFIIGGDVGIAAIRLGGEWCRIETGTLRALQSFDLSADRRVLISASRDTNTQQSVVWFDFPEE